MYFRRDVLIVNIGIVVLIVMYFMFNISSNMSFKHKYFVYSLLDFNTNDTNQVIDSTTKLSDSFTQRTKIPIIRFNVSKMSSNFSQLNQIQMRVKRSDEYLRRLSKFKRIRSDSRLIYPNEMFEMTKMTINHNNCSELFGKDLLLLVMVFNRVDGFKRRETIRETWGQEIAANPKSRLYFAVGLTKDTTVQQKVVEESERFGDILQFSYYESYYNCTIKAVGLLRWTAMNCPFVKFMLKVDDDSVVLPKNLLEFNQLTEPDHIFGYLWRKPAVVRGGQNKWTISSQDYPHQYYPDYIGGPYLIPGRHTLTLYETVVNKCLPALPFEDVYITGAVANVIQIERKKLPSLLYLWDGCHALDLDFCYYKSYTIFWQKFEDNQMKKFWQIYQKGDVCPSNGGQRC